ncbi:MAG TPA: hypothetical protein DFR83_13850 [Deltaproteobacteria bacterium]|nr:hypothetical protein [Deltaproteobacteria bacterium]
MSASAEDQESPSLWRTGLKLLVGFAVIFALSAMLGVYFNEPLEAAGTVLIDRFGLAGLAAATFIVDCLPTPLGYIPFMLLANVGGVPNATIFSVCFGASFTAGLFGYTLGRGIGMPRRIDAWMREKHPRVRQLLDSHGVWGVVFIAALPLPLALGTWSAGALRLPPQKVALALLVRIPKTAFFLAMIESGLMVGGG